jgi:type I restriction enzyme M protein
VGVAARTESPRLHRFTRQQIADRDDNLDIGWLKDESLENPDDLPEPEDLVAEALTQLQTALDALNELANQLGANGNNGVPPGDPEILKGRLSRHQGGSGSIA